MNKIKTMLATAVLGVMAFAPSVGAVAPADYGLHEGDVIRASGDVDVFIVNDYGFKRLFVNPQIFNLYGHLGFDKVKEVTPATRDAFETSGLFRNCDGNDQKVFGLEVVNEDTAVLHWVNMTGSQAAAEDAAFFKKVFCINGAEQALYGMGTAYTALSQIPDYSRGGSVGGSSELNGNVGNLEGASFIASLNNEEVGEGDSNVKVAGLKLEADNGSDLRLMSVKIELQQNDTGSKRLSRYADSVSLWLGSDKLATIPVADFNKDGDVYSKSVSVSGVVPMDGSANLYVTVSANDTIDSVDLDNNDWDVTVDSIRYVDAEGAITSDSSTPSIGSPRAFSFASYASSAELELKASKASDSPDAGVVEINKDNGKDNVFLLAVKVKATGGDISLFDVDFVASASSDVVDSYTLDVDGETFSEDTTSFSLDGLTVSEDEYVTLKLYADVNEDADGKVVSAKLLASGIEAEDKNGDSVSASGNVDGEDQLLTSEGVNVELVSTDANVNSDGDVGTFKIKFNVTAFGDDTTIGDINYVLYRGSTPVVLLPAEVVDSNADGVMGAWTIDEGQTKWFELTVAKTATVSDFYKLELTGIEYGPNVYTFNLDDFEAGPVYLN